MQLSAQPAYILDDPEHATFRVNRAALVDADVLARERLMIFDRGWLYAGHDSELQRPGDFHTRDVGGRPVILARDGKGQVRALLNTCRHRGATVCRERTGNARRFNCFYHGWSYGTDGTLLGVPGEDSYGAHFDKAKLGLMPVPRLDSYRD